MQHPIYAIAVGVPAKVKNYRFDEETMTKLLEAQWWNGSADEIKRVKEYEFRVGESFRIEIPLS